MCLSDLPYLFNDAFAGLQQAKMGHLGYRLVRKAPVQGREQRMIQRAG